VGQLDQFGGLGHILVDGIMAAVKHDAGETGLNAGLCTLVGAMVQMQGHGHGDAQAFVHGLDHGGNGLKTGHVFTGAFGDAQDHGAVHLLRGEQDGLGPLQIVDVELAHGIMTVTGFDEHIACAYQHFTYLHYLRYIRKRICCSGCTSGRAE